jgi:hypothetical protein
MMNANEPIDVKTDMLTPHRRQKPRGFTLLETMVSGTLLLLGLAGVMSAIVAYQKMAVNNKHQTQGIHIAESVMEEILLAYPNDTNLAAGLHGPVEFDEFGHEVSTAGRYLAYWDVVPSDPVVGIRKLTVRVDWLDAGATRNVSFFTYRR